MPYASSAKMDEVKARIKKGQKRQGKAIKANIQKIRDAKKAEKGKADK